MVTFGLDNASRGSTPNPVGLERVQVGFRKLGTGSARAELLGTNESGSKVAFRLQRVMSSTVQLHVVCRGLPTSRERDTVMALEKPALATAFAIYALERALLAVALVYLSNHRAWNVT